MTQWINCVTISNHNSNKTIIKKNKTIIVIGRIHGFSQRVYNSFVHAKSFDPNLSAGLRLWNWKKVFFFGPSCDSWLGLLAVFQKNWQKWSPKNRLKYWNKWITWVPSPLLHMEKKNGTLRLVFVWFLSHPFWANEVFFIFSLF